MVDIIRPEYGTVWASEGEKLSPTQDKIELGWVQEMMPFQWENFLQARQDEAITYLLQKGIPEYSATQEYVAQKSVVLYQGAVYLATQTVTNVLPSVAASWKRVSTISDASGVVSVAGGGTGATTAVQARTNLGLGTASTLNTDVIVQKDENGNFSAGVITASLAGNATSADKLKTARMLQVTGVLTSTPTPFDGTSNVSIPVTSLDASGITSGTVPTAALNNAVTKTSSTGSAILPAGSTEQRDTSAQEAYFRYNKTTKLPEFHDSVGWKSITGLNSGNFVEKTSSTGAAYLPAGLTTERPGSVPSTVFAMRLNKTTGKPEWYSHERSEWQDIGGTGILFEPFEHNGPVETIPEGFIPANGQTWYAATYPDAAAALEAGNQFLVSESDWQVGIAGNTDAYKGCWSSGGTDEFGRRWYRAPKLNRDGDYRAPFLRGSEIGVDAGKITDDRIRDFTFAFSLAAGGVEGKGFSSSVVGGTAMPNTEPRGLSWSTQTADGAKGVTLKPSLTGAPTGPENSPRYHGVIMCIRMFGTVSNPGSVDAAQLATDLGVANARIAILESRNNPEIAFIYPNGGTAAAPANVVNNWRGVFDNPWPGFHITATVFVYAGGEWGASGWYSDLLSGTSRSIGIRSGYNPTVDKVIIQTGSNGVAILPSLDGGSYGAGVTGTLASAPCYIMVEKKGKRNV